MLRWSGSLGQVDEVLDPGGVRQADLHGDRGRAAAVVRVAGDPAAERWAARGSRNCGGADRDREPHVARDHRLDDHRDRAPGTPRSRSGTPTATNPTRSGLPMSLAVGQTVTIPVRFAPTVAGAASSEITVTTSRCGQSASRSHRPGSTRLGCCNRRHRSSASAVRPAGGTPVSAAVSIANVGATGVTITGITKPPAPFAVTGLPAVGSTIAPLSSIVGHGDVRADGDRVSTPACSRLNTSAGMLEIPVSGTSAPPPVLTLHPDDGRRSARRCRRDRLPHLHDQQHRRFAAADHEVEASGRRCGLRGDVARCRRRRRSRRGRRSPRR